MSKYSTDRIAFIQAGWHSDIVGQGRESFISELEKSGFPKNQIDIYEVPGSLEIPLQAKLLAKSGKYSLIACGGLIVDGGIYRHEFVTTAVIDGIMRVSLDTETPILSMILTPKNFHEHDEHHTYFFNHFQKKGKELASAAIATLENMKSLKSINTKAAA